MKKISNITFLIAAWVVATIATLGSLYFSEIRMFQPCTLCWYQRILMYPMVIILGIAAYTNDQKVAKYSLGLSLIGGSISIYHILLQNVPAMKAMEVCTFGVPCSGKYINWFGFVSIPVLAFVAFAIIAGISAILIVRNRKAG